MINDIISAISKSIYSHFGSDYEIYKESLEQGLIEPCFWILCINNTTEKLLNTRKLNINSFCIHYFPKSKKQEECFNVLTTLTDILEYLNLEDTLIEGTNIRSEIVEGVLYFFINYDIFTLKTTETESAMTDYNYKGELDGE